MGIAYIKPTHAPPGEVECCEKCMVFRRENPEASPLVVSVNHSDQHVEWIVLGFDHIHFQPFSSDGWE